MVVAMLMDGGSGGGDSEMMKMVHGGTVRCSDSDISGTMEVNALLLIPH